MEEQTVDVNFIISCDKSEDLQYRILGIIPSKRQDINIVDNEIFCDYVDTYRIRYKLIVANMMESPVSEVKDITKFAESEINEILLKTGLTMPGKKKVEVADVVYV